VGSCDKDGFGRRQPHGGRFDQRLLLRRLLPESGDPAG